MRPPPRRGFLTKLAASAFLLAGCDPRQPLREVGELTSRRRGLTYIDCDLSGKIAARRAENLRHELPFLGFGLLLVVLSTFWLDRGVTAPLQALGEAMKAGDGRGS